MGKLLHPPQGIRIPVRGLKYDLSLQILYQSALPGNSELFRKGLLIRAITFKSCSIFFILSGSVYLSEHVPVNKKPRVTPPAFCGFSRLLFQITLYFVSFLLR